MKSPQKIERASRANKRLHLIEATITALHVYGPSRTTVDKIVEIAQMSPGIVTFYFDSKAAMLVAALDHLATEFEDKVLKPVSELRSDPVAALDLLVSLYFDPDLASSRKISVWYAFWGEATSRAEYLAICGRKDAAFAATVRDHMATLVAREGRSELDPDAIALGLMGVLEMLWQEMAFQDDAALNRKAIRARCMAYLSSIFPGRFASTSRPLAEPVRLVASPVSANVASGSADQILAVERDRLFLGQWQYIGPADALGQSGDFITAEIAGERVLAVRGRKRARGFLNLCRHKPHALVTAHRGVFDGHIECPADGWQYKLDGTLLAPAGSSGLMPVEVESVAGLVFGRLGGQMAASAAKPPRLSGEFGLIGLEEAAEPIDYDVAANWKTVMDQLLEGYFAFGSGNMRRWLVAPSIDIDLANRQIKWRAGIATESAQLSWTDARLVSVAGLVEKPIWQRCFVFPNLMVEVFPSGAAVWQVSPIAPGSCRITVSVFAPPEFSREGAALFYLALRYATQRIEDEIAVAESTEIGLRSAFTGDAIPTDERDPVAQFRRWIAESIG